MASDQPLKKISQLLLLSVSVFSFIFSYSLWCSSLVYPFKVYFSAYPIQLVTHALNKNCIFLLCNGLLVFLAKTSGLVHSRAGFDLNDLLQKKIGDSLQTPLPQLAKASSSSETLLENAPALSLATENQGMIRPDESFDGDVKEDDQKAVLGEESKSELETEPKGEEEGEISEKDYKEGEEEDEEEEEEEEVGIPNLIIAEEHYKEEEEEGDDDDPERESTEELNKKFEDFIRRMNEEITTNT